MAIGEVFIGAFITVLFEKLASSDLIKLARSAGIESELNKLKNTLTLIRAVLADAGQKHITNTSVQFWLNQLQHLAYEIDDVLDDLATEAMRRRLNKESDASTSHNTSKVLKFIPTKFHALKYGRKMSSKLDQITTKLVDLVKEKELLGLKDTVERPNRVISKRLEETSLVDESKIIGREVDKEVLLGRLLGGESSSSQTPNVEVVSIVGLGGIGKTTLAQLLYNDNKVKRHFDLKAWVCVSDMFDVSNITKTIFQAIGGGNQDFADLNLLQVALSEKLSKRKFLLVLDDVWNEKYKEWELLQRPFRVGSPGSKILMTTRNAMVASVMDSVQTYSLELLSNEEALSLFSLHASSKQNVDVNRKLKLYGEDIIRKCGRLPLALRTLGRVFGEKSNDEEWEDLLNSEIWDLDKGSEILPALYLSYYDLASHLKQMFAYCSLFPKDYLFKKDELVLLWMAEGFLSWSNTNKSIESFGRECFEELVSRSFFQHSTDEKSLYIMHDLLNDLATSVAGEFYFMLDDKNEALEKVHHVSFISGQFESYKRFKELKTARHLRTFLPMSVNIFDFHLSNNIITELLPQLQFLRVLSLASYEVTEIPESIGRLKHMRYLNFSTTLITSLPEQIGELFNLQSLLLFRCRNLRSLPDSIVKLINLRHLDITDTPLLNKMPLGFGGLTSLQTLSGAIFRGAGGISDLKGLLNLQGQVSIQELHNVKDARHVKEANLQQKKGICNLRMMWCAMFDDSQNQKTEYEVLEGLRPFEKLTSLEIDYYGGTKFPSWVGDPSFDCLTQLTLYDCRSCECLPTLGHLPSLQNLYVSNMDGLKSLGFEFLSSSNSLHGVAFPSLQVLRFHDMMSWEEWSTTGGDKDGAFPCLRELYITNCPKLDVVAIEPIPSLEELCVERFSLTVLRSMVGVSSSIAKLSIGHIKGLTQLHGDILEHLKAVKYLSIYNCDEVTYLWESDLSAAYENLVKLQRLEINGCASLVSLGEKEEHLKIGMESVTEVAIVNCPRLETYNCPKNIEKLQIAYCHSLTSLTFPTVDGNDLLPSTMKMLYISDCENVEVSWILNNNFLSSLESLDIYNVMNLRLLPEGCLVHLTKLTICDCDNIESILDNGYGFLPFHCLRELKICNCKNLKSFPHEQLQSLTSLERMVILKCQSLDDFPFPCGLWPPNLSCLEIGELKKDISEWGMQNFPTSLVQLELYGDEKSGVVSFAAKTGEEEEDATSFLLPSSLTSLGIWDFKELESLSEGLQHLTCLQHLVISSCPKLRDLPETLLPSLSKLVVHKCSSPKLRKKCTSGKGKYWPIISQIPRLELKHQT